MFTGDPHALRARDDKLEKIMRSEQTPMMEQYLRIKADYPDTILFYRLGDFYEMFFDDAIEAAKLLEITLTTRNKNDPEPVPLCGVPYHAAEPYIAKLIQSGKKVAICEQVEDPEIAKGIVKREVVRIITPGVVLDGDRLDAKSDNYLAAVVKTDDQFGVAFVDISTGHFVAGECHSLEALKEELLRYEPREILVSQYLAPLLSSFPLTIRNKEDFAPEHFVGACGTRPGEPRSPLHVQSFSSRALAAAAGALSYLKETQRREIDHLFSLEELGAHKTMRLDESTKRNLELLETLREREREGSLLGLLDHTKTAMGARLLRSWILSPLLESEEMNARLFAVSHFVSASLDRERLRTLLQNVYDLERLMSKIAMRTANARDLVALASSLKVLPEIKKFLSSCSGMLFEIHHDLEEFEDIVPLIENTLVEHPPFLLREGAMIKSGISAELDELRQIAHSGKDVIARMETQEKERTGISSLKIKYNKIFGYFIEVTHVHREKIPADYIRKQTLVSSERYITPMLKEYEEKVLGSEEKGCALEYGLFLELRESIAKETPRIFKTARALAILDVLLSFAYTAVDHRYICPEISDDEKLFIEEGRHPIVELLRHKERFIPNDLHLGNDAGRLLMITGPNMAGKSTIMRQTALIVLMAQIGSFVPAKRAEIGIVDRIFTRVGASDALSLGQSTFMVEMAETAVILKEATSRSLILIDEIGRGTSTFDGLAIAWAVAEELHDHIRSRTLFATHYHELIELARTKPFIRNFHVAVKDIGGEILFLRKLIPGGISHSYGLHVAKLAGFPESVLTRARGVLTQLETGQFTRAE